MVHPSGEKRRYQLITLRSRYGGSVSMPECQKAKIDLEPWIGGGGWVRSAGSESEEEMEGRNSWGMGEVPGMLG